VLVVLDVDGFVAVDGHEDGRVGRVVDDANGVPHGWDSNQIS
jgi:hypothetical protein